MPRRSVPKPPPMPSAVWVLTTSTYEQYIGRYAACMAAVLWLAAETFGFRVRGLSPAQNLLANFGWYLMLAALIWFIPPLYDAVSERFFPHSAADPEQVIRNTEDPEAREALAQYYAYYGGLPPDRLRRGAACLLFCIWLFELFFILAWVQGKGVERHLVWRPDWAEAVIAWFRANIDVAPYSPNDHGIFMWESIFTNYTAEELLHEPIADAAFLLHFFRLLFALPVTACVTLVLWKILYAMGASALDMNRKMGLGRILWLGLANIILLFVGLAYYFLLVAISEQSLRPLVNIEWWVTIKVYFSMIICHLITGLWMLWGWVVFWKRCFVNLIRRIKNV